MTNLTFPAKPISPSNAKLKLVLLGVPQISVGNVVLNQQLSLRAQALLYYLAVEQTSHDRSLLASLFWPDSSTQQAKKNLRNILPELRNELDEYLEIDNRTIRFCNQEASWCDLNALHYAIANACMDLSRMNIQAILDLRFGEFLDSFSVPNAPFFEEWQLTRREQFNQLIVDGLTTLAKRLLTAGEIEIGIQLTRALLQFDRLHEPSYRLLMQFLVLDGQQGAALTQYDRLRQKLASELNLEPDRETQSLANTIRAGQLPSSAADSSQRKIMYSSANQFTEEGETVAPLSIPANTVPTKHNLPGDLTPFLGRKQELLELRARLLQPNQRLITLCGLGGVGKTRLALALARTLYSEFVDGIWFVSLERIKPGARVLEEIADAVLQAINFKLTAKQDGLAALCQWFQHQRRSLLILDRFEHLEPGAQFIVDLLRLTDSLKILVTSRHTLNLQAESVYQVIGLPVPKITKQNKAEIQSWMNYDSVALFVERVQRRKHQVELSPSNLRIIVEICQWVEGLPLAVELAAALTKGYALPQLLAELKQSHTLLSTQLGDLPPRQQSIQALFDSSWQLLTPLEAEVLLQCAPFCNGFTSHAAAAICGASLATLNQLEEKSLLYQTRIGRYAMHPLLHQYATAKLHSTLQLAQQVRSRHTEYYLTLLQQEETNFYQDRVLRYIFLEDLSNLQAAWHQAIVDANWQTINRSLRPLVRLLLYTSHSKFALFMLNEAIHGVRDDLQKGAIVREGTTQLLVRLLLEQCFFCVNLARLAEAEQLVAEAKRLLATLQDQALEATLYARLGTIAWAHGNTLRHREVTEQALTLARLAGERPIEAHCLYNLGMNYDHQADYDHAVSAYRSALTIVQELNDLQEENIICNNLGVSYGLLGNYGQSYTYYQQTLQVSQRLGDHEGEGYAQLNLGILALTIGDWPCALLHLRSALHIFRSLQRLRLQAKSMLQLAKVYWQTGRSQRAALLCRWVLEIVQQHSFQDIEAEALLLRADMHTQMAFDAAALADYQQAEALWQKLGKEQQANVARSKIAYYLLAHGELHRAMQIVETLLPLLAHRKSLTGQGVNEIALVCYQVLEAHQDPRALAVLQGAINQLQRQAESINDEVQCHSFWQEIPVNRTILALAKARRILSET